MNSTQITTKSSRQCPAAKDINNRSCISIAKLYDWTEGIDADVSSLGLYKDKEAVCKSHAGQASKLKTTFMISNGNKTAPVFETDCIGNTMSGRMFARDKKILTKGEKEIIEGIYKNRGDIADRDIVKSKLMVKSHKEAWYSGKPVHRNLGLGKTFLAGVKVDGRVPKSCCHFNRDSGVISCVFCDATRENTQSPGLINTHRNTHYVDRKSLIGQVQEDTGEEGYLAPPSTPDEADLNLSFDYPLPAKKSEATGLDLQAENIHVHDTHYSKINDFNKYEPKSTDNVRHKSVHSPHSKSMSTLLRWASDDFSVFALKSPNTTSHEDNNRKKTSRVRQTEKTNELINNATHHTRVVLPNNFSTAWADAKETEHGKKVRVNIYLPTAEGAIRNSGFTSSVSVSKKQCYISTNMLPNL